MQDIMSNKIVYADVALRETKIVMENGAMKLYVPPEYLMILMTKQMSFRDDTPGYCLITYWEYLKNILDEYIGENFEYSNSEIMRRVIEFLNNVYMEHEMEINVMKAIKENL